MKLFNLKCHHEWCVHAKNQDRSPHKISRWRQFSSAGFISVSRDFTPCFHFWCVARATFDRNLIHSAAACFLVMVCVGYSRVQLKTLSSLLDVRETCTVRPELFDKEMHDNCNGLLGCQQLQLNCILNNP